MLLPVRPIPIPPVYIEHAQRLTDLITAARVIVAGLGLDDQAETVEAHAGLSALLETLQEHSRAHTVNLQTLRPTMTAT